MRRPSHTRTSLQTHACTQMPLHTDPTTLGHNHTPTFWRTTSFTRRPSYARTLLHTNSCTHTHIRFNTQSLHTKGLHTQTFIRKLFHIRTTYPYTHAHTHRHHLRTIFAPITNDVYFFCFCESKFLLNPVSVFFKPTFVQWIFLPMCMSYYCNISPKCCLA